MGLAVVGFGAVYSIEPWLLGGLFFGGDPSLFTLHLLFQLGLHAAFAGALLLWAVRLRQRRIAAIAVLLLTPMLVGGGCVWSVRAARERNIATEDAFLHGADLGGVVRDSRAIMAVLRDHEAHGGSLTSFGAIPPSVRALHPRGSEVAFIGDHQVFIEHRSLGLGAVEGWVVVDEGYVLDSDERAPGVYWVSGDRDRLPQAHRPGEPGSLGHEGLFWR